MKQKFRTTTFWLGVSGAIVIILECISDVFGINLYSKEIENVIMTVCSALVMLGIITKKTEQDSDNITKDELIADIENFKNDDK